MDCTEVVVSDRFGRCLRSSTLLKRNSVDAGANSISWKLQQSRIPSDSVIRNSTRLRARRKTNERAERTLLDDWELSSNSSKRKKVHGNVGLGEKCKESRRLVSKSREKSEATFEAEKLFPIFRSKTVNPARNEERITEQQETPIIISDSDEEILLESCERQVETDGSFCLDLEAENCVKREVLQRGGPNNLTEFNENILSGVEHCQKDPLDEDVNLYKVCFPLISHCNNNYDKTSGDNKSWSNVSDENQVNSNSILWNNVIDLNDSECTENLRRKLLCVAKESVCEQYADEPLQNADDQSFSDAMWTDISDILKIEGNRDKTREKIRSWMLDWKRKFTTPRAANSDGHSSGSDSSDAGDDCELLKAILVTGLPGTGKTSTVNAVAAELGFKVLEVNASSCRSGSQITSQLREAFQSYHVENTKVFIEGTDLECKATSPDEDVIFEYESNSKKISAKTSPNDIRFYVKSAVKTCAASEDSAEGFVKNSDFGSEHKKCRKMKSKIRTDVVPDSLSKNVKRSSSGIMGYFLKPSNKTAHGGKMNSSHSPVEESCKASNSSKHKISNLTLILFDDVDVMFDEDAGFWQAVNAFLKTTKKPVVFTAGRNVEIVANHICTDFDVLNMNNVLTDSVFEGSHISSLLSVPKENLKFLMQYYANDMRRTLLNLQFWCKVPHQVLKHSEGCYQLPDKQIHKVLNWSKHVSLLCNPLCQPPLCFSNVFSKNCQEAFKRIMCCYYHGCNILYNEFYGPHRYMLGINVPCPLLSSQPVKDSKEAGVCTEIILGEASSEDVTNRTSSALDLLCRVTDQLSYADVLNEQLCKYPCYWQPTSDRLSKWTLGLPACSDDTGPSVLPTASELVSFLTLLSFRKAEGILFHTQLHSQTVANVTDASLMSFSMACCPLSCKAQLRSVATALPVHQRLSCFDVYLDYLSTLKNICRLERGRENDSNRRGRRFLHYFDAIAFQMNPQDFIT